MQRVGAINLLDANLLDGNVSERARFIESLLEACRDTGAFYLGNHSVPADLCSRVLQYSADFFNLTYDEKADIHISKSQHFRGYSQMSNERDWREQVHFGLEMPCVKRNSETPVYYGLQGPNLWPQRLGDACRMTMLAFLEEIKTLGKRLLDAVAEAVGFTQGSFANRSGYPPYMLMKLINYLPQPQTESERNGVAAHCDWSWLTLLLQNDAGLQVQSRNGQWIDVPPIPETFVVNLGELIEMTTGGYFRATPHRVRNISTDRPRVSIPIFVNPGLKTEIKPVSLARGSETLDTQQNAHVHRVADPRIPMRPFIFGESEWKRKGLGRWCYATECCGSKA